MITESRRPAMATDAGCTMNGLVGETEDVAVAPKPPPAAVDFESVYAQGFGFVWRNLRRLGVPEHQLRDAAQDVFVVVHRRLGDWDGSESIRPWLYSILRRVAADTRRRRRRKEWPQRGEVHTLADFRDAGPENNAARNQEMRLLHALLERLDDDKREVLILVDLEGMTVPEVAALLSANLNTVYSRLRAARQAMREGYAQYNGIERDR
jgi:RNA polymerase sigma-70 factor (ECF subfamily)